MGAVLHCPCQSEIKGYFAKNADVGENSGGSPLTQFTQLPGPSRSQTKLLAAVLLPF